MSELKIISRLYTWSNRHTCSKINKAIVNANWMLNIHIVKVNMFRHGFPGYFSLILDLGRDYRSNIELLGSLII